MDANQRPMPSKDRLPHALYRRAQVGRFDAMAIGQYGIPGIELMNRAGAAAFARLRENWPDASDVTVLCGIGNNGGDGYVVARLALEAGLPAKVLQVGDRSLLKGDARASAEAYRAAGGDVEPFGALPKRVGVLVDALFGTGLARPLEGEWREAVDAMNRHGAPVLALDVPSGLDADLGTVLGTAVSADATVTFIGLKQGMFTGDGPECCGRVHFDPLGIPAVIYSTEILSARRVDWRQQASLLTRRPRNAHKGDFGHLLVIGGNHGFSGAARLAAEGAARTGAGLVSVATRAGHAHVLNLTRPELMCHGCETPADLRRLLSRATAVAVGPGLGQDAWSRAMFGAALESGLPMVVDADALNLLAEDPLKRDDWVLTPHPGEAARLLGSSSGAIQSDRFQAVQGIRERFGGAALLKGAGSLVAADPARPVAVISEGNPGMASGGMGDVLTGIAGTFLAQGFSPEEAAVLGGSLHAAAGDLASRAGERGMLASDLFSAIRRLLAGAGAPC